MTYNSANAHHFEQSEPQHAPYDPLAAQTLEAEHAAAARFMTQLRKNQPAQVNYQNPKNLRRPRSEVVAFDPVSYLRAQEAQPRQGTIEGQEVKHPAREAGRVVIDAATRFMSKQQDTSHTGRHRAESNLRPGRHARSRFSEIRESLGNMGIKIGETARKHRRRVVAAAAAATALASLGIGLAHSTPSEHAPRHAATATTAHKPEHHAAAPHIPKQLIPQAPTSPTAPTETLGTYNPVTGAGTVWYMAETELHDEGYQNPSTQQISTETNNILQANHVPSDQVRDLPSNTTFIMPPYHG